MGKTDRESEEKNKKIEEMKIRIAEKIREDSKFLAVLTSADTINLILADMEDDTTTISLVDMQMDERYQDIKSITSPAGTVSLFSDSYIGESQAQTMARAEGIETLLIEKVRERSGNQALLTGADSFTAFIPDLKPEEITAALAEMAKDEKTGDIKSMVSSTGALYLYSAKYISENYANILIRAEENDPCLTIAATVRDEARIYPRATRTEFFDNPVFNIDPEKFESYLVSTLERPEFKDIKLVNASTGTRFLYSDLYLDDDYAMALIEEEEVGRFDNP